MNMKSIFTAFGITISLTSYCSYAAQLVFVNHTGEKARIAELFNVCQGNLIPLDQPVFLENGESRQFEVSTVMQHYKICGSGFCSSTAIQMKEDITYELEMVLDGSLITGVAHPDQWGGPTNECPY